MLIEIDGDSYEIVEIPMEEGFNAIGDGSVNIPALIRASVLINGEPAKSGQISLKTAQLLMPDLLKINGLEEKPTGKD